MRNRQIYLSRYYVPAHENFKTVIAFIFFHGREESSLIPTHVATPHRSKSSPGCLASYKMCKCHGKKALEKSAK